MEQNIDQKPLAVVTGASSGIGYELAKVFAKNGFDLIVAAEDGGIVEAASAFGGFGVQARAVQADLSQPEGVAALYQAVRESGRPVEALAVNAGVGVSGEFANTSIDEEVNLVNLNVLSTIRITKKILKDMLAVGHGRILITSSIAAEMPGPYYAVYAASKSFVQSFAEALRVEVADKGVVVTALQPGPTDTNFFARAHMENTDAGKGKKDSPAEVAEDGFKALMKGLDHVVAGSFKNKVQVGIGKVISEKQGAKMQAKSTKPKSAH